MNRRNSDTKRGVGRSLGALRAGFGFLTRLPAGKTIESDWDAFCQSPWVLPIVGFVVGGFAAIPMLATGSLPGPTVAVGYVTAIYLLTGIHHLDGVADLGDAIVVHGDRERRRSVLKDTTTGVGAILAVSLVVAGLALGGLAVTTMPIVIAVTVVVAAEVGAKLGMATMAAFGTASHDGLGSQLIESVGPTGLVLAVPASISAAMIVPFAGSAAPIETSGIAMGTLGGAILGATVPWVWARRRLGGINGDVFGAANEVGRLVGLHVGVIAWTLF